MHLRDATAADIPMLQQWQRNPHVIASGAVEWDWEAMILPPGVAGQENLIAEVDGRAIGYLHIVDPARDAEGYWGDVGPGVRALDIWIGEEADTGRGLGSEMMRLGFARCFEDETVSEILIDPLARNTAAHRFYERLGFEFVEQRRFDDDVCSVYRLTRAAWRKGDDNA